MLNDILKSKQVVCGLIIILIMFCTAVFAPLIATHDPYETDVSPEVRLQPPSRDHIFGTDDLGRDIFSRMVHGALISLTVGFIAVFIMLVIGVTLGALAGYYGGKVDAWIMRLVETMLCVPPIYLILIMLVIFGPSIVSVMVVIGLTSWTGLDRLVRTEFLSLRERDFVAAAKACLFQVFSPCVNRMLEALWVDENAYFTFSQIA